MHHETNLQPHSVEDTKEFWSDGDALFPKLTTLLVIQPYLRPVIHGLILSIGSKNEATVSSGPYLNSKNILILSSEASSGFGECQEACA